VGEIYNISGNFEQKNIITFKKILDIYFRKKVNNYEDFADFNISRKGQDIRYAIDDTKIKKLG
jgi:dTDP-D-glucose 4,6-dehydratase